MTEILSTAKVSVGWRICLTAETCKKMNIDIGDKVVLFKNADGEIIIRSNKPVAIE